MGKGDKKSRRGKIYIGSFGKRRPRKKIKHTTIIPKIEKSKNVEMPGEVTEQEKTKNEKPTAPDKKPKKSKSTKKDSKE